MTRFHSHSNGRPPDRPLNPGGSGSPGQLPPGKLPPGKLPQGRGGKGRSRGHRGDRPPQGRGKWLVLVVSCGMGLGVWLGWRWWSWAVAPVAVGETQGTEVQVEVSPGMSAQAIGDNLAAAGLIRSPAAWGLWSRWLAMGSGGSYQAGIYGLSPQQSMEEIAQVIWTGQVEQVMFTVPEGWSLRQMGGYFEDQGWFTAAEFLAAASQIPRDRFPWLPEDLPHLEGFLFPETYALGSNEATPEAVIDVMLGQFEQVAIPLYEAQSPPQDLAPTLEDWVILASIVEKEAVVPEERTRIAGVLANRLRIGMNLQVDPTVEYGLGIQQTPDRPLTLAEVQTPSPYNTYINPGLPPTAIASPGLASLEAVLQPESHDYLYFVARYDGTHVFSQTLADHEAAQEAIHDARDP